MKKILKNIKKTYIFSNKFTAPEKTWKIRPLFTSEIFTTIENSNLSEKMQTQNSENPKILENQKISPNPENAQNSSNLSPLKTENFKKLQNLPIPEQLKIINSNPVLSKNYKKIGPFSIYSKLSNVNLRYVIASNYIENLEILELLIMDVDGFCSHYLEIGDLVPLTYRDLNQKFCFNVPFMDFVCEELVFQDLKSDYFVFERDGVWDLGTANLEGLDFRSLYCEDKWIDRDLDE